MKTLENTINYLLSEIFFKEHKLPPYYKNYLINKGIYNRMSGNQIIQNFSIICNKFQLYNKNILEIGSLFGIDSIILSKIGNNRVFGIEIDPTGLEVSRIIIELLGVELCNFENRNIENNQFPSESFDFIFAHSVVSHVSNYYKCYEEIYRILKKDGTFFFIDENNFLRNRKFRRINWDKADTGPESVSKSVLIEVPYIEIRKEIIKKHLPDISDSELYEFSKATRGYLEEEIVDVINNRTNHRNIQKRLIPRNPLTGFWAEREINPFKEIRILKSVGFRKLKFEVLFQNKKRNFIKSMLIGILRRYPQLLLLYTSNFSISALK